MLLLSYFFPGFSLESREDGGGVVLKLAFLTQVLLSLPTANPALQEDTEQSPRSQEVLRALGMAVQSCL